MSNRKAFIKLFAETGRYHNRYEVFRDVVTCHAYSLHNAVMFDQGIEDDYLRIAKKYEKDDLTRIARLMAYVVMGLEEKPCDFLGSVFMELDLGSSQIGQFFTPYEVSLLMAKLNVVDLCNKPIIRLYEPAEVCIGNTLTLDISRVFKTPAYHIGGWSKKLDLHYALENCFSLLNHKDNKTATAMPIEQFDLLSDCG